MWRRIQAIPAQVETIRHVTASAETFGAVRLQRQSLSSLEALTYQGYDFQSLSVWQSGRSIYLS